MSIFHNRILTTSLLCIFTPILVAITRDSMISPQKTDKLCRFVIHEHNATHLHYDLRLEYKQVLKSWAIPKKPSMKRGVKRLAIQQPDHELSYISFEGILPEGSYGAGTVKIWDSGTYFPIKQVPFAQSLKNGKIEMWLEGKKLHGAFALIKTNFHNKDEWLFMKINDELYLHSKE